jgi:hypothetical protein
MWLSMQLDHRRCAFAHMLTWIRAVCCYLYSSMSAGFVDAIDDPLGVARVGVMCPRGMRSLLRHLNTTLYAPVSSADIARVSPNKDEMTRSACYAERELLETSCLAIAPALRQASPPHIFVTAPPTSCLAFRILPRIRAKDITESYRIKPDDVMQRTYPHPRQSQALGMLLGHLWRFEFRLMNRFAHNALSWHTSGSALITTGDW